MWVIELKNLGNSESQQKWHLVPATFSHEAKSVGGDSIHLNPARYLKDIHSYCFSQAEHS